MASSSAHHKPDFFCSDLARQAGEQIFGSVTPYDTWFLLEYNGPYGDKAFDESDLPAGTKARLSAFFDAAPRSRTLLIRRQRPSPEAGIVLYVVLSSELDPLLFRFQLAAYEDALALDVEAMRSGDPAYRDYLVDERLFVVCTNGKRDPCCARRGVIVFQAIVGQAGEQAWQSSHVGGHRYAANVLCFPHALYYGYISPDMVGEIVESYRQGTVLLDYYRGRSCYDKDAQAAEYFLRRETGIMDLNRFRIVSTQGADGGGWAITFEDTSTGAQHRIRGKTDPQALMNYMACRDAEPSPIAQFHFTAHEVVVPAH